MISIVLTGGFLVTLDVGSGLSLSGTPAAMFEKAVEMIKKYETMHKPKHWPLVGYGHKVLPGEKFNRKKTLTEEEADALLRKDLLKNCAYFRHMGKDSLLLGILAYNIGQGAVKRSTLYKKLLEGDRDIRENYIAHCRYKGKVHSQIKRRRIEEFDAFFFEEPPTRTVAWRGVPPDTPAGNGQLLAVLPEEPCLRQVFAREAGWPGIGLLS